MAPGPPGRHVGLLEGVFGQFKVATPLQNQGQQAPELVPEVVLKLLAGQRGISSTGRSSMVPNCAVGHSMAHWVASSSPGHSRM